MRTSKFLIHKFLFGVMMMVFVLSACRNNRSEFDASGVFEAVETIVPAEAQGILRLFEVEEGQILEEGQQVGYIDSVQLHLKKEQLEAQIIAIAGKLPDIPVQLSALQEQLKTTERERDRVVKLLEGDGATPKQLDDITAQAEILKKQIEAQKSSLVISSGSIEKEIIPLQIQIEQLADQLNKCRILNPVYGTVLTKYAEVNEMASVGKPLYKIADLSTIILRVYVTGNQLPQIRLNQKIKIRTDDGSNGYKQTDGTVIWISDKAEFTPKTIQTKEERVSKVYAVKIKVENDGSYKIGMYGEVSFNG